MVTLTIQLPDTVAATFFDAADELNERLQGAVEIDPKSLMVFALARNDCENVCAQFDLALRMVRGSDEPPFNPAVN